MRDAHAHAHAHACVLSLCPLVASEFRFGGKQAGNTAVHAHTHTHVHHKIASGRAGMCRRSCMHECANSNCRDVVWCCSVLCVCMLCVCFACVLCVCAVCVCVLHVFACVCVHTILFDPSLPPVSFPSSSSSSSSWITTMKNHHCISNTNDSFRISSHERYMACNRNIGTCTDIDTYTYRQHTAHMHTHIRTRMHTRVSCNTSTHAWDVCMRDVIASFASSTSSYPAMLMPCSIDMHRKLVMSRNSQRCFAQEAHVSSYN